MEHGKVVGILELEGCFIDTVGVDPVAKGRGYGRALMLKAMSLLRESQADEWACMWI